MLPPRLSSSRRGEDEEGAVMYPPTKVGNAFNRGRKLDVSRIRRKGRSL